MQIDHRLHITKFDTTCNRLEAILESTLCADQSIKTFKDTTQLKYINQQILLRKICIHLNKYTRKCLSNIETLRNHQQFGILERPLPLQYN